MTILNDEKIEFLFIGTPQQLEKVVITHIRVDNTIIHPVPVARNLGSWLDSKLSMKNILLAYLSTICMTYSGPRSICR